MTQTIYLDREIIFQGDSNQDYNITGNFSPRRKYIAYEYQELALDNTSIYTENLDTSSTIAIGNGGCVFTTDATDNKVASQAQGGIFVYCAKNPTVEMRFKLNDVTNVAIFSGLNDATSEGAATLPFALSGSTLTDTCTDGVGFLFDTDQTLDYWNVVNTKNGTQAFTQLASSYVPVNATDVVLRTSLDATGNASYYYNGVQVANKLLAVTAANPLVPFFGIKNMSASAHVATLKYVRLWMDM